MVMPADSTMSDGEELKQSKIEMYPDLRQTRTLLLERCLRRLPVEVCSCTVWAGLTCLVWVLGSTRMVRYANLNKVMLMICLARKSVFVVTICSVSLLGCIEDNAAGQEETDGGGSDNADGMVSGAGGQAGSGGMSATGGAGGEGAAGGIGGEAGAGGEGANGGVGGVGGGTTQNKAGRKRAVHKPCYTRAGAAVLARRDGARDEGEEKDDLHGFWFGLVIWLGRVG